MDVVQGNFAYDINTGQVTGVAPGQRQYLDPEIADEGTKVIMSDGTTVSYNPPPVQAAIFRYDQVKKLQKYFNRNDWHPFPTWLYHPELPEVMAKNAKEAWEVYGVRLVERSPEEIAQFGGGGGKDRYKWDFADWSKWRVTRYHPHKFDPENPDTGKIYVPRAPDPKIAQHELIERVIAAMQSGNNDFMLKLLSAMQATTAAKPSDATKEQEAALKAPRPKKPVDEQGEGNDLNLWRTSAETIGIKVDNRWSVKRLKQEIAKVTGNDAFVHEMRATMDESETGDYPQSELAE